MSVSVEAALERLAALLAGARRILVFSGAGISTGSGIPDFRGPQGVWRRRQPVYFQDFLASDASRTEYWDYKSEGYEEFRAARPNAAHRAVADLAAAGRLLVVVTQNIDGLHQAGGLGDDQVIELHGTNLWVECVGCGVRSEPGPAVAAFRADRRPPRCAACGGWLKFATISFGQALRPEVLERAVDQARRADLVLALGSTLSVQPAASIPLVAAERGAPYAIINQGPTEHDEVATVRLEGDVGALLPRAVAAAQRLFKDQL